MPHSVAAVLVIPALALPLAITDASSQQSCHQCRLGVSEHLLMQVRQTPRNGSSCKVWKDLAALRAAAREDTGGPPRNRARSEGSCSFVLQRGQVGAAGECKYRGRKQRCDDVG
mmetsp:Transcript_72767/g.200797  ORF Transcript_72767/g.200797 Transcript_72767/m.200797 type:complete len:114 (-) Transcript_72767:1185-1526(-)